MKFVDDKCKNLTKRNKNYFWCGTIFVTILLITIFATTRGSFMYKLLNQAPPGPYKVNVFVRFFYCFCARFSFSSWSHLLYDILGLVICGFYLERKYGTLNFILLLMSLWLIDITTDLFPNLCASFASANEWFTLWGFTFIDFLFSFRKENRNITNIILSIIVLLLLYIRSGFYDLTSGGIGFSLYPHQLLDFVSHFTSFVVGIIVSLIVNITKVNIITQKEDKTKN